MSANEKIVQHRRVINGLGQPLQLMHTHPVHQQMGFHKAPHRAGLGNMITANRSLDDDHWGANCHSLLMQLENELKKSTPNWLELAHMCSIPLHLVGERYTSGQ